MRNSELTKPSSEDRVAIGDVIACIGLHANQGEWDELEALLMPELTTDYTSLFGGSPVTEPREEFIRGVRDSMPLYDAAQHLFATNYVRLRDPDHACARSYARVTHRVGDGIWVIGGLYSHELTRTSDGWRASHVKFTLAFEEGDRSLLKVYADRPNTKIGK